MARPKLQLTRFGAAFVLLIVVSLMGFTNYAIALGYAFSFLLGGVWIVNAAMTVAALRRWQLEYAGPPEGFAQQPLSFGVKVQNTGSAATLTLQGQIRRVDHLAQASPDTQPSSASSAIYPVQLQAYLGARRQELVHWPLLLERGVWQLENLQVQRTDFLGLWRASLPLPQPPELTIYPTPEVGAPALLSSESVGENQSKRTAGNEDLSGLRSYREGDLPRQISWKHAARRGELITREFDAAQGQSWQLTWQAAAAAGASEARIARLTAWVHAARAAGVSFSLNLSQAGGGSAQLALGSGELHAKKALLSLALLKPHSEVAPQLATVASANANSSVSLTNSTGIPAIPMQSTLLALAFAFVPLFLRQPFWMTLITGGSLVYLYLSLAPRRQESSRQWPLPSLPIILAIVVGAAFLLAQHYQTLLGQETGTALLALLIIFKAVESKSARDGKVVVLLGIFAIGTHFFIEQNLLVLLHVILALVGMLGVAGRWMTPHLELTQLSLWPVNLLKQAARALAIGFPLALLLFVLYPRPVAPLWTLPSKQAQTGLGNEINAGAISNLAESNAVAFRVDFAANARGLKIPPANAELYWRGPVYELYDGIKWTQARGHNFFPPSVALGEKSWRYTISLEPNGKPWLLGLDLATDLPPRSFVTTAFQAINLRPANTRKSYQLTSQSAKLGLREDQERLLLNRALPRAASNPRALALARSWQNLPPAKRVEAALALFGNGQYRYSLKPPTLPEQGRIDTFLYQTKQGFCEYYASAFAFLMRAAGVPTRLVAGYQGAEPSLDGDYWIVRQKNAHAWTEVWLAGQGWVRIDPTAVVAPARIELGLDTALDDPNSTIAKPASNWQRLMLQLDAWQTNWNNSLNSFDADQQREFLQNVLAIIRRVPWWLYLLLPLLGGAGFIAWRHWQQRASLPKDPTLRALTEIEGRLKLPMSTGEPLSQYAKRASQLSPEPEQAALLGRIVSLYQQLRYGESLDPVKRSELEKQLFAQVRQLKPLPISQSSQSNQPSPHQNERVNNHERH